MKALVKIRSENKFRSGQSEKNEILEKLASYSGIKKYSEEAIKPAQPKPKDAGGFRIINNVEPPQSSQIIPFNDSLNKKQVLNKLRGALKWLKERQ